jgi:6-phosphogluconolactonase
MGNDGHTASLFPYTHVLGEIDRFVVAHFVEKLNAWRITFTSELINAASHIIFLVSGPDKAETLYQVLQGEYDPEQFPAQLINPEQGTLLWLVDAESAANLRRDG